MNNIISPLNSSLQFFTADINSTNWHDWHWQERNALTTIPELVRVFPGLSDAEIHAMQMACVGLRFKVTPHMLSLVQVDSQHSPLSSDPIWAQFLPSFTDSGNHIKDFEENWEMPDEMVNPITQHKYRNRLNLRIQNRCLGYCMYCFEAKRVLDTGSRKDMFRPAYFENALEYIYRHPEIEEIVISGGEPLVLSNKSLNDILGRLRTLKQIRSIRIQTRALTHNPYRLDTELIDILKTHDVTAMAFHVAHPVELGYAAEKALNTFGDRGCRTLLLAHIPLLKNVNDSADILSELFMRLFTLKVKPYYLLHAMPHTLGSERFRTSVKHGVRLLRMIKRHFSNPAVPEYIIVHSSGKHTVPIELDGTSEFQYDERVIRFRNWKEEWHEYLDAPENNNPAKAV